MRPRRLTTHAALAGLLLACATTLHADQPDPARSGEEPPCRLVEKADELLAEAESASDAALTWLQSILARQYVEDARSAAERKWTRMVEEAREHSALAIGTFLYTPDAPVAPTDPAAPPDTDAPASETAPSDAPTDPWTPIGDLADAARHERLVLLIHGLDEPGDIWTDLAPALHAEGHAVARFNYPNDQHPAAPAELLALEMRRLGARLGTREVDLVCHSMGGLIARDLLTRPGLHDPRADGSAMPRVGRLITVGTPNHGSVFAPLRALGEVREHFARWIGSETKDHTAILGFLADGDGAAADALQPGSEYLAELNARPLPQDTEITIVIGRASPLEADDLDPMLESEFARRVLGEERIERLRRQTGRVVGAVGDGVVTVESARLEGVEDTVILDANHRSLLRRMDLMDKARRLVGADAPDPPAIDVILDRLGEGADAPESED